MTGPEVLDFARESILVLLMVVGPIMGATLAVGLSIALLQALTQVQEMTLVFVPKILVIFVLLLALLPFIGAQLAGLMTNVADRIAG